MEAFQKAPAFQGSLVSRTGFFNGRLAGPIVAPSMLKCDFGNLELEIRRLEEAKAEWLHWDIMDGHFVPNVSYGALVIAPLRKRTSLVFDAHLMLSDPGKYVGDYLKAGCDAITFHIEAVPQPVELLKRIRQGGALAGLAINPKTPVSAVLPFLGECDQVLVMSVEPGFGGQSFMPDVLPKVETIRQHISPRTYVAIDGGIGPDTIGQAAKAGAQVFVAGSSIFDQKDYVAAMSDLEGFARQHGRFSQQESAG